MSKQRRRRFSAAESAEIWDRWQRGEGLKLIGRMFGKNSSSIFAQLTACRDIGSLASPARKPMAGRARIRRGGEQCA